MNKVYDRNGNILFVERDLGDELLVSRAFEDYDGVLYAGENVFLVKKNSVFDKPPKQAIEKEIEELTSKRDAIAATLSVTRAELAATTRERDVAKNELDTLLQRAGLGNLPKFLRGEITHYVVCDKSHWRVPRIMKFDDTKGDREWESYGLGKMRMLTLFGASDGNLEWRLNDYKRSNRYDGETVIPCTSEEEVQAAFRQALTDNMQHRVSREYADAAIKAGIELPDGYLDSAIEIERKRAIEKVEDARKALEAAEKELAAIG